MIWTHDHQQNAGDGQKSRTFQGAIEAAQRIIPDDDEEPLFFVLAAREVLAGLLHGLGQSAPRRVSVVELMQTVQSYERVIRTLQGTPEGREIHRRYFTGSTLVLTNVMCVLADRVMDLVDRKSSAQRP